MRRYDEAAQALRQVPYLGGFSFRLAACYGQLGLSEAATAQATAILAAEPNFSIRHLITNHILLEKEDDRQHLREGLLKAGLPD